MSHPTAVSGGTEDGVHKHAPTRQSLGTEFIPFVWQGNPSDVYAH